MYGYENSRNPSYVKSRTGFVDTVVNCPVLRQSKLESEKIQPLRHPSMPSLTMLRSFQLLIWLFVGNKGWFTGELGNNKCVHLGGQCWSLGASGNFAPTAHT